MTIKQQKLIHFIANYRVKYGISPTLQEMADGIPVSDHKSVSGIISALIKQGYLEKGRQKSRSTLLTDKALEFLGIPLFQRQELAKTDYQYHKTLATSNDTITSLSPSYVGHGQHSFKTDGTSLANDIRTVLSNTLSNISDRVSANEETGTTFSWALLLTGLTLANIQILGNGANSLVYTTIEAFLIKTFLIK